MKIILLMTLIIKELEKAINNFDPEIIFHLAAQPLVIPSYLDPYETFFTNIMGTINLLNISRKCPFCKINHNSNIR